MESKFHQYGVIMINRKMYEMKKKISGMYLMGKAKFAMQWYGY
jgi:hypothetical protein